jgi:hypothetical protein
VLEGSTSFLKKRSKKLLDTGSQVVEPALPWTKSFLVLFFKKELLAS